MSSSVNGRSHREIRNYSLLLWPIALAGQEHLRLWDEPKSGFLYDCSATRAGACRVVASASSGGAAEPCQMKQ